MWAICDGEGGGVMCCGGSKSETKSTTTTENIDKRIGLEGGGLIATEDAAVTVNVEDITGDVVLKGIEEVFSFARSQSESKDKAFDVLSQVREQEFENATQGLAGFKDLTVMLMVGAGLWAATKIVKV